jgi:lipopolysaccharide cholinephosphotransferase
VNYNGVYGTKEITHKRILGKPTLYQFENAEFYGVENFHVYLKNLYGDYMRVPPLKERTNHSLEVTLE